MALLLAQGSPHRDHLAEFREIRAHLLLRNFAVVVEKGEAVVAEDVLLHVAVEFNQAVLAAVVD